MATVNEHPLLIALSLTFNQKNPFAPEHKSKWMSLKPSAHKADLKSLEEQLKVNIYTNALLSS